MTLIIALVVGIWLLYGLIQIVIGVLQIIWAVILFVAAIALYLVQAFGWLGRLLLGLR